MPVLHTRGDGSVEMGSAARPKVYRVAARVEAASHKRPTGGLVLRSSAQRGKEGATQAGKMFLANKPVKKISVKNAACTVEALIISG